MSLGFGCQSFGLRNDVRSDPGTVMNLGIGLR